MATGSCFFVAFRTAFHLYTERCKRVGAPSQHRPRFADFPSANLADSHSLLSRLRWTGQLTDEDPKDLVLSTLHTHTRRSFLTNGTNVSRRQIRRILPCAAELHFQRTQPFWGIFVGVGSDWLDLLHGPKWLGQSCRLAPFF